jgi:hypothetical protein
MGARASTLRVWSSEDPSHRHPGDRAASGDLFSRRCHALAALLTSVAGVVGAFNWLFQR